MRNLYPLFFLLWFSSPLAAQSLEVAPLKTNPLLERLEYQRLKQQEERVRKLLGAPPQTAPENGPNDCPPETEALLVTAGEVLSFEVDTFGLGGGNGGDALRLLDCQPLQFGSARLDSTTLRYEAAPDVQGVGFDRLCVEFCRQSGACDTLFFEVGVRRTGASFVAEPLTVEPESVSTYCLGDVIALPGNLSCSALFDAPDDYDGTGRQNFSFTTYLRPDTCLLYYATRFPGTDTVGLALCDEFAVCDTFKIPIRIPGDTLSLPFFEDFSRGGPYPDSRRWLDDDVFVNHTLAANPPSVGLATFDGLDRGGSPYELIAGPADFLTSAPIDLSPFTPADSLALKFYLAPKGFGLGPSFQDSLLLQFRDAQRQWHTIASFPGFPFNLPLDSVPPFEFFAFRIDDPAFFHQAFQFRFIGYSSPGGISDLWHLDYIWLDANETLDDNFPDIAFMEPPSGFLKTYTSMPLRHYQGFEDLETRSELHSAFFNHFPLEENLDDSRANYREVTTATNLGIDVTLADNNLAEILPKTPENRDKPVDFSALKATLNGLPPDEPRVVETTFKLAVQAQGVPFRVNDTVHLHTPFADYFSYDDGSAERQIFIRFAQGTEQIAVKFHANQDDTLRAVQFMFPHVNGDVQNQLFNLRIWVDSLNTEPVFERQLLRPFYADNVYDTLQGFTTYRLEDLLGREVPVFIPKGDFFVGWQQATATEFGIPVGFDINNTCEGCNFLNLDGEWNPFPSDVRGVIMVRPVFSQTAPKNTVDAVHETARLEESLRIYPNPTAGLLLIEVQDLPAERLRCRLFDATGRLLLDEALPQSLNLSSYPSGLYWLQVWDAATGTVAVKRIVLNR